MMNSFQRYVTKCKTSYLINHVGCKANSVDPDQMPQNVASDRGLRCLLTGISIENRIKMNKYTFPDTFTNGNRLNLVGSSI